MAAVGAKIAGDTPPQCALPALIFLSLSAQVLDFGRLASEPRRKPVGAIRQVLFEQRRSARRELVAHHFVRLAQVAGERRMLGDESFFAEYTQHAPRQHRRRKWRRFRDLDDMPDLPPQPLGKVRKPDVRADA